jgi:hypothetical protein
MSRLSRNIITILGPDHRFAIDGNLARPADNEYGWRDMIGPFATGRVAGANVPTWATFRDGINTYSFSAGTMNEIWFAFHPNHDVAEGENYFVHIHWSPGVSTNTGVVRWGIEYTQIKGHNQAAFPASTTIYLEDNVTGADQYGHRIIEDTAGITMPEVDSLILMRVFRDAAHANDTFPDAAFGLTCDIHYRADRFATKGKTPDFNEAD